MTQEQLQLTTLVVSAAATLALAFFGGVQLYREHRRLKEFRAAARGELEGPAWLARQQCDDAVRSVGKHEWVFRWADTTAFRRTPLEIEQRFLEVLKLASTAGRSDAEGGRAAFELYLAAAARIHRIASLPRDLSGEGGYLDYSPSTILEATELQHEAVSHLRAAIDHLEVFAPRREHEPALPPVDDSPQLESGA